MGLLTYSAVTTKVRAMDGKLLTDEDYYNIAGLSSVSEFVEYLKTTAGYGRYFSQIDSSDIHRGQVEKLLNVEMYEDFVHLYRFADKKVRNYLDIYYMKLEIILLKSALRGIFDHSPVSVYLGDAENFFLTHSDFNIFATAASTNIQEFLASLGGSQYGRLLSGLDHLKSPTLFDYETKLDLYYFSTIWKTKDKILSGTDLDIVTEVYGTRIDLVNMQWIYRSKKYHHLPPAEIYSFIIPHCYKLKKHQLSDLVNAEDAVAFINIFRTTAYAGLESKGNFSLEHMHKLAQLKISASTKKAHPYSIAAVNTHLYLREQETRNLVRALECIRYGLSQEETLEYIRKPF